MARRALIQVVALIVVIVFAVGIHFSGDSVKVTWLKYFSAAVLLATWLVMAWDHLIWRLPLIHLIPGVPRNVQGTWKGTLESFWKDPATGIAPAPKAVYLVIRQTASAATIVLLTDESRSQSTLAKLSDDGASRFLDYIYLNFPDSRFETRSRIHHGSTSLEIIGTPPVRLKGKYWTNRDSRGVLDFTARSTELAEDFESAAKLFASESDI
jgi:hypothetical protein